MKRGLPFLIAFLILIGFTAYFAVNGNYEFINYAITNSLFILLLYWTDKKFKYYFWAKWGFVLWLLLHVLGGSLSINGVRLYDTILINFIGAPLHILRYDQVVHAFCYFIITTFAYSIMVSFAGKKTNKITIAVLALLIGMGVGAMNEISEFNAVIFSGAAEKVGDYYNNALDLVFNFLGSLISVLILSFRKK